jgi:hypothetical protein
MVVLLCDVVERAPAGERLRKGRVDGITDLPFGCDVEEPQVSPAPIQASDRHGVRCPWAPQL